MTLDRLSSGEWVMHAALKRNVHILGWVQLYSSPRARRRRSREGDIRLSLGLSWGAATSRDLTWTRTEQGRGVNGHSSSPCSAHYGNPIMCFFTLLLIHREWNVPHQGCRQSKPWLQILVLTTSVRRTGKRSGTLRRFNAGGFYCPLVGQCFHTEKFTLKIFNKTFCD